MGFLLDTNIVSELRKRNRCHSSVQAWRQSIEHEEIFLSVLTFGELRRGIEKLRPRDAVTAQVLERWVRGLRPLYAERILPVTWEICDRWGRLSILQPLPTADGLLAATALQHNLTLATRNTADFERSGVDLFNPFLD